MTASVAEIRHTAALTQIGIRKPFTVTSHPRTTLSSWASATSANTPQAARVKGFMSLPQRYRPSKPVSSNRAHARVGRPPSATAWWTVYRSCPLRQSPVHDGSRLLACEARREDAIRYSRLPRRDEVDKFEDSTAQLVGKRLIARQRRSEVGKMLPRGVVGIEDPVDQRIALDPCGNDRDARFGHAPRPTASDRQGKALFVAFGPAIPVGGDRGTVRLQLASAFVDWPTTARAGGLDLGRRRLCRHNRVGHGPSAPVVRPRYATTSKAVYRSRALQPIVETTRTINAPHRTSSPSIWAPPGATRAGSGPATHLSQPPRSAPGPTGSSDSGR